MHRPLRRRQPREPPCVDKPPLAPSPSKPSLLRSGSRTFRLRSGAPAPDRSRLQRLGRIHLMRPGCRWGCPARPGPAAPWWRDDSAFSSFVADVGWPTCTDLGPFGDRPPTMRDDVGLLVAELAEARWDPCSPAIVSRLHLAREHQHRRWSPCRRRCTPFNALIAARSGGDIHARPMPIGQAGVASRPPWSSACSWWHGDTTSRPLARARARRSGAWPRHQ